MNPNHPSIRLPSVSVVLSPTSSEEDVRAAAAEQISDLLDEGQLFEIVNVEVIEEGEIITPIGAINAVRYCVAFQKKDNIVFLHPDYYEVMAEYTKARGLAGACASDMD